MWEESGAEPPPREGDAWLLDDTHDGHMMSVCVREVLSVFVVEGCFVVWAAKCHSK